MEKKEEIWEMGRWGSLKQIFGMGCFVDGFFGVGDGNL
jgi:hypothetical protein